MKKTIYAASISLLVGFSLVTSFANALIPFFWDRRLIVQLGLLTAGTLFSSALTFLAINKLIWPYFQNLTKIQRIVHLLLLSGGVIAILCFQPLALPPVHNTFEIQTLSNTTVQNELPSIIEIHDVNGNKVDFDALELNDGWKQVNGMLVPQAGKTASLMYQFIGQPGQQIQVLFFITRQSEPILIISNGLETITNFPQNLDVSPDNFWESFVVKANPAIREHLNWIVFFSIVNFIAVGFLIVVLFTGLALFIPNRTIYLKKYPWIYLVPLGFIAIILFWRSTFHEGPDSEVYLSLAKNLYHGTGYVYPNLMPFLYRGPVFPLLISFSYRVFGEAFRSAIILERILWVLTIFVSYMLGMRIYNPRVGLIASLLVITTGEINNTFSAVGIDGILVFIILLLTLITWEVFINQHGTKWYVLMGLLMGTAYLVKQTSILYTPLPFLTWVIFKEYRTRQVFIKLLLCYSIFALFVFGWMGYIYLAGGSQGQIAGDFQKGLDVLSYFTVPSSLKNATHVPSTIPQFLTTQIASIFKMVRTFYSKYIAGYFKIAIIFPIALLYSFCQALLKKSKPDIFLGIGLLLFIPLIPIQAYANFGFRQNLYFYFIVIIFIAAMLDRLFNILPLSKVFKDILVFVAASSLILLQIPDGIEINFFTSPTIDQQTLNYYSNPNFSEMAAWVDANIKPDENILIYLKNANVLHILTAGNRTIYDINTCIGEISFVPARRCSPPYIIYWINKGTENPDNPRDLISGISEPGFISTINEKDVKYVIVTPQIYYLYYYLKIHPDFEEVVHLGYNVVFRVIHPVQPLSSYPNVKWETCVGKGTPEYLKNLHEIYPARYEGLLRNQFEPWMGLTSQDISAFESWQGCEFDSIYPGTYKSP